MAANFFFTVGNRRFRVCISNNLIAYESAKSKHQKSIVVTKIVDVINECSTQERGGFVRKDLETGRWFEVEDKIAREKVGHALRDAIKITKKQMAKKRNLETPAPNQAQKRQRSEQSVAARSSVDGFAPVASPTSLVAGLASIRSGIVKKQLPKPALVAQDDECSTMGENSDLPASSYDEWKKSLKESANTFSLSDDEDAGDENSPDGDAVLSKMASETASSSDPDSMLELLNTVQLCGASPYSVNIVKPRPAQNRNSCWDTSTSFGSILLAPSQRKPADKYLWRPPGGSRTEDLYNDFLLSTAASSQVLNCSKGKKFPEKNVSIYVRKSTLLLMSQTAHL